MLVVCSVFTILFYSLGPLGTLTTLKYLSIIHFHLIRVCMYVYVMTSCYLGLCDNFTCAIYFSKMYVVTIQTQFTYLVSPRLQRNSLSDFLARHKTTYLDHKIICLYHFSFITKLRNAPYQIQPDLSKNNCRIKVNN